MDRPPRSWRTRAWLALALALTACDGCPGSEPTEHQQAPPLLDGELVEVGGRRLNLRCEGRGTPLVVFESGLGMDGSAWRNVQPAVSRVTRTCAYDRAGLGKSERASAVRGQDAMARELHALLEAANESGPFILVGHSMGAAIVRWFQREHPADVVGMVLLDPTTYASFRAALAQVSAQERSRYWEDVGRLEGLDQDSMTRGYQQLDAPAGRLGNTPMAVLTAGKPTRERPARHSMQGELAGMSSNSVHLFVEASGHNIHLDEPQRVIAATVAVVEAARTGARLTEAAAGASASP